MKYTQTTPCKECPFLKSMAHGFTIRRLSEFASGPFPCHKSAVIDEEEGGFTATEKSVHCAGALIFLEKRKQPNQMMRIAERLGLYDYRKLDMTAPVR
jgi:hypothetical protein